MAVEKPEELRSLLKIANDPNQKFSMKPICDLLTEYDETSRRKRMIEVKLIKSQGQFHNTQDNNHQNVLYHALNVDNGARKSV